MFFPCDPYQVDLLSQLEAVVAGVSMGASDVLLYALVDGASNPNWGAQMRAAAQRDPQRTQSLYQQTSLQDAQEYSPFLCAIEPQDMGAFLTRASGMPMLSFLQSDMNIDALRENFAPFLLVGTGDAQRFPIRWAYPLAVPLLMEVLGTITSQQLCSGFRAWHLITREGGLHSVAGSAATRGGVVKAPVDQRRIDISQSDFARLVDAAEADALLISLLENFPALMHGRLPSALYQLTVEALQAMTRRGIEAQSERRSLLITLLNAKESVDVTDFLDAYVIRRQTTLVPSHG